MTGTATPFYVTGGTLPPDARSYVERRADAELHDGLTRGEFCYVLTARQMGKSSLIARTANRLCREGVAVAGLDLTAIGQNLSPDQWYGGLVRLLGHKLDPSGPLEDDLEEFWWEHQERLGPMQRWVMALREVVLPRVAGRLVIFIDEIDVVRGLPFSTDEFFAGIRECYNRRSDDPEFGRVTFCLMGVASPSDLIRDTRMTPFNIGRRIELSDFTEAEALPLAAGLVGREEFTTETRRHGEVHGEKTEEKARALLRRILYWTGGHPYLTQRLCRAIAEARGAAEPSASSPCSSPCLRVSVVKTSAPNLVDRWCDELFLSPRTRERDDNLLFVRERLLRSEADRVGLLELYGRVRQGRRVPDDETNPLGTILRLSGIVRAVGGELQVRNRIYARVFDRDWVTLQMPDAELRRQRAAFRRGVARTAATAGVVIVALVGLMGRTLQQERLARAAGEKERQERRRAARLLYDADMQLAARAWDDGAAKRVEDLLAQHEPRPGEEDLRGFEWRYLWKTLHESAVAFRGHAGAAFLGTLTPEGHLVTLDEALQLRRWDTASRRLIRTVDFSAEPLEYGIALSHDGRTLAVRTASGAIRLLDTETGELKRRLVGHPPGAAFVRTVYPTRRYIRLTFSPDDTRLVSLGDCDGTARVWDASTGRELHRIRGLKPDPTGLQIVQSVTFSPDGRTRALADHPSNSWAVPLLNAARQTADQALLRSLYGDGGTPNAVAYSPDGSRLAVGHMTGTINLWDPTVGKHLRHWSAHTDWILRLCFSPDGRKLATGSKNRLVRLWDVATGARLRTLKGHT